MDRRHTIGDSDLAVRLVVPGQRWGWEFTPPRGIVPSPLRAHEPIWAEAAPPPRLLRLHRGLRRAPILVGTGALLSAWGAIAVAAWGSWLWLAVLPGGIAVSAGWPIWIALRYWAIRQQFHTIESERYARFRRAHDEWAARVGEQERQEHARVAATILWYPLVLRPESTRVDIFGGTTAGWISLLATAGTGPLAEISGITVLDFTERRVAAGLAAMWRAVGQFPAVVELGDEAAGWNPLAGLTPPEIGELIAATAASARTTDAARGLHAELAERAARCLTPPVTLPRLAAAVRALRRLDPGPGLGANEVRCLTDQLGALDWSEPVREELRFLGGLLDLLAVTSPADAGAEFRWPPVGLHIYSTASADPRRKNLLDRLLFHRTAHSIRRASVRRRATLIVAGADDFGLSELEGLARHAQRIGIRLVTMIEHLRGELIQLLGAADGAAILMRLGNAAEAAAAAEFVGRGHRFVLSQLTDQYGRGVTEGYSDTTGDSATASRTDGYSATAASVSSSWSRNWSSTVNWSEATSMSAGRTVARAYEYAIEPVTFQSLPPTALILVETGRNGRRVAAGDCNPGITLLDRVSGRPRAA
ncbi:hypothetical protein [Nocardia sp. alder85J]|uniref:hypothetical protein n=1 Tax=Nocardia sp. alder85J TaxID=2862949 RepID=UPI001CD7F631|nr:hypothetical protein [Nocardia sp. alder85J]MCX4095429.1 hypothetical protein [Nocardia sp. alder85J]